MNTDKVYEDVRDYIDEKVFHLSPGEYVEFLELLIGELDMRYETARNEIEDAA